MLTLTRSYIPTEFNWGRVSAFAALFVVAMFMLVEPAFAQNTNAFGSLETTIKTQTCNAFSTGKTILYAAAALSLIVGIAPMLWGQVKVKWLVSCMVAAVLFGIVPTVINAFAGNNGSC